VLSLIYVPTEANIPILEAGRNLKNPKRGASHPMPFDRTVTVARISALSRSVRISFYKIKNFTVDRQTARTTDYPA
jgi:hypothetical protein